MARSCATVPRQPQDWQKKPPERALQAQLAPSFGDAQTGKPPLVPKTTEDGTEVRPSKGAENAEWPLSLVMSADGLEEGFGLVDTVCRDVNAPRSIPDRGTGKLIIAKGRGRDNHGFVQRDLSRAASKRCLMAGVWSARMPSSRN